MKSLNPHFPALRSDPPALSGASRRKQIHNSNNYLIFESAFDHQARQVQVLFEGTGVVKGFLKASRDGSYWQTIGNVRSSRLEGQAFVGTRLLRIRFEGGSGAVVKIHEILVI